MACAKERFPIFAAAMGALAQLARAFDWQSRGHRFDSVMLHKPITKSLIQRLFFIYSMDKITPTILLAYLAIANLIGFAMYGIDKAKAKQQGARRIPEKTLLNIARFGGGLGCWAGMKTFHHKTLHKQFNIVVPLWTIIWAGLVVFFIVK